MKMVRRFGFVAVFGILFCGASFAQTEISTWQEFVDNVYGAQTDANGTILGDFIQTADIEVPADGFKNRSFNGTYDGNGFKFYSTTGTIQKVPMFNNVQGIIRNVTIDNIKLYPVETNDGLANGTGTPKLFYGTICSCLGANGGIDPASGVLSYCAITNGDVKATGKYVLGGLVGQNYGTIEYCYFEGDVIVSVQTNGSNDRNAGGIAGCNRGAGIVTASAVGTGTISTNGQFPMQGVSVAAGIAPVRDDSQNPIDFMGGVASDENFVGEVSNCYNGGATVKAATSTNIFNPTPTPSSNSRYAEEISNGDTDGNGVEQCYYQGQDNKTAEEIVSYLNTGLETPAYILVDGEIAHVMSPAANGKFPVGKYTSVAGLNLNQRSKGSWTYAPAEVTEWVIANGSKVKFPQTVDGQKITVKEGGQLVAEHEMSNVVVEKSLAANRWNFIGFPIAENNGLQSMTAEGLGNIWAIPYNYAANQWNNDTYLYYNDNHKDYIEAGNGIFVYTDTESGELLQIEGTAIAHGTEVSVVNNITATGERWVALANPYTEDLDIATFLANAGEGAFQGNAVYRYNGTTFSAADVSTLTSGSIGVGEGFFVNLNSGNEVIISNAEPVNAVAAAAQYVELSVSTDNYKVPVRFAVNELADVSYDCFDANKLFGDGTVAEPYLLCEGRRLCKEEVNALPYIATMNVRSGEARSVEIVAEYIPEAYSVILVDGETETELTSGMVYTTDIASGENAERFSLKIGKSAVSIQDVAKAEELNIRNNNRIITINGGNNISVEVYNALGQKVYETKDRSFELGGVAAGAYVVKVKSGSVSHSSKIVVR